MNLIKINDLYIPELKIYSAMNEKELLHYDAPKGNGLFIAESPKVIERALDAGYEPISMLMETRQIEGEAKEVVGRMKDVPIYTAEFDVLTGLTGFELTRGALCAMRRKKLPDIEKLCEEKKRIAVLDGVVNPTNVGAIMRSAAALNIDAVLLTSDCADPLYRRAVRVSMGTVFQIPWTVIENIGQLKALGFTTVAMALKKESIGIDDKKLRDADKLAIIMGTEGDGLSDTVINECDYTAMIPMSHGVDSLNVAAASAVIFWELGKHKEKN